MTDVNEPAAAGGEGQRPSGASPGGEEHLTSSASTPTRAAAGGEEQRLSGGKGHQTSSASTPTRAAAGGEEQRLSGAPPGGEGHLASSASTPTRAAAEGRAATSSANLLDVYASRIADCGFRSDQAQLAAVAKLDDLRSRLIAAHAAASSSPLRRWLGSLMGGSSAQQPERGLYLWGGVGRGKTWLMDMFFQSLPFPQKRRRHFHRFMHDVHVQLKGLQNRESPLESVAEQIADDTRVLCFDELFVADIADAMILGGLFEGLFKRGVTLVATSNVPPRDLYKDGLQRQRFLPAIDLIESHVDVLNVDGATDYRLRQLTQAGTYLLSSAPDTPQRLEALFAELAHYGNVTDGTIEIEGRTIPVVRQSSSAVWFEFDAICGGPRSQDDYIEIAREYQSVIVADVPILDSLRENQARRFIALVDELYDRNVNLIISAAAPPVELYRGDRLSFQFERTVSRLIEMQSEDYLAREHRP